MAAIFTNAGRALHANLDDGRPLVIDRLVLRYGGTRYAAAVTDTDVSSGGTRVEYNLGYVELRSNVANNTVSKTLQITGAQSGAVTAVGLFSGSTLVFVDASADADVFTKAANEAISYTFQWAYTSTGALPAANLTVSIQTIVTATLADVSAGNAGRYVDAAVLKEAFNNPALNPSSVFDLPDQDGVYEDRTYALGTAWTVVPSTDVAATGTEVSLTPRSTASKFAVLANVKCEANDASTVFEARFQRKIGTGAWSNLVTEAYDIYTGDNSALADLAEVSGTLSSWTTLVSADDYAALDDDTVVYVAMRLTGDNHKSYYGYARKSEFTTASLWFINVDNYGNGRRIQFRVSGSGASRVIQMQAAGDNSFVNAAKSVNASRQAANNGGGEVVLGPCLDSPATAEEVTYRLQMRRTGSALGNIEIASLYVWEH